MEVSIAGLDKKDVLQALYGASKAQGMGFLHFTPGPLTSPELESYTAGSLYFDYLKGRVLKVDISKDTFDSWGYDRDNGDGAAERSIAKIRR